MADNSKEQESERPYYMVRLFVAGDSPNSLIAKENLRVLQERIAGREFDVEIVDVLADPQAALDQGIYVTPALQIIEPGPERMVFGNLSNREALQTLFPERMSDDS